MVVDDGNTHRTASFHGFHSTLEKKCKKYIGSFAQIRNRKNAAVSAVIGEKSLRLGRLGRYRLGRYQGAYKWPN